MSNIVENIKIYNFLSVREFDWEIKDFNILTGGMATGKSVCLKLIYFFEQILRRNLYHKHISKDTLVPEVFFHNTTKRFYSLFPSVNPKKDFYSTKIEYTFKVPRSSNTFDLSVEWNGKTNELAWKSDYIESHIDKWRSFLGDQLTPESVRNARMMINENIAHDFFDSFPVSILPIPASRAIGCIAKNIDTDDEILENFFYNDRQFVMDFNNVSDIKTNKILNLKEIRVEEDPQTKEKSLVFESKGGRKINSLQLSSGQQEAIYLLLLMKDIQEVSIRTKTVSILIEEPCAHLFPQEQKETIEYCADIFRRLRKDDARNIRYFITTHSPYILNTINNMLKKGSMINKFNDQMDIINSKINFPYIFMNEFSAKFINDDGTITNILDPDEEIMFPDKILEISSSINKDTNKLDELYLELSKGF